MQQIAKQEGPHQIIRIKTRELKPKPKQLSYNVPTQQQQSGGGFKPIIGNINSYPQQRPTPGQLIVEEVNRRQGAYDPADVVYDDQQPLLTLDTVSSNTGHFRARARPDNYSVNVQASLKSNNNRGQARFQRRLMRVQPVTKKNFTQILNKRPQSNTAATSSSVLTPKFESTRIVRPN